MPEGLLSPVEPEHTQIHGATCPYCDQPIPTDRLEEISGRIAARERQWLAEETIKLREQHVRDTALAEEKAQAKLEQVQRESVETIERLKANAVTREAAIKSEAEKTMNEQLIAAAEAKQVAEQAAAESTEALKTLKEAHATEINHVREVLAKDKETAVNNERAQNLETRMKLEGQLADMQRQLQKQTSDQLGEGAELDLYELLKGSLPDDKVRRVTKGTPGADIVIEVMDHGSLCGRIVIDSKNRNLFKSEWVTKLRQDQIAAKADYAILSSNKFPTGRMQLCMHENVLVASPARVEVLVHILRDQIIRMHEQRITNDARDEKAAELLVYITSAQFAQQLDTVDFSLDKLERLDVAEEKAHRRTWVTRGKLQKDIGKAYGDLWFEINRITGIAEPGP